VKWEYKKTAELTKGELAKMGQEQWELVGVYPTEISGVTGRMVMVFKRPIKEKLLTKSTQV